MECKVFNNTKLDQKKIGMISFKIAIFDNFRKLMQPTMITRVTDIAFICDLLIKNRNSTT